jgi:hypothetical protein
VVNVADPLRSLISVFLTVSPGIIRLIKSLGMRMEGHVARMGYWLDS